MEEAIEILTKMMIAEHIEGSENKIVLTKEELMRFCIKLLKTIQTSNI